MGSEVGTPRVVWTCVTEDLPAWHDRVVRLALSIRRHGGRLRDAPIVVRVVDGVSTALRERLRGLDVATVPVSCWDTRTRHLNKLRMLEALGEDYDVLAALDCDVVVTNDLTAQLDRTSMRAKPVDADPLSERQWARLYDAMGMPLPPRGFVASSTGRPVLPYVNSGVLLVPRELQGSLLDAWDVAVRQLQALMTARPVLVPLHRQFYLDQYALAFGMQAAGLPLRPLGVEHNWPLHVAVHPRIRRELGPPTVIHYHGHVDSDGFLMSSPTASELDGALDRFNRQLADHLDRPYTGLRRRPLPQRLRRRAERAWLRARDARSHLVDLHPAAAASLRS